MSDSAAVLDLKRRLNELRADGSDWAEYRRRYLQAQIRAQRLREARERGTHTDEEWQAILEKFDYRCVVCGRYPDPSPCKDHILPIFLGGSDSADNLQPLCRGCNSGKGGDSFNWAAYRSEFGFSDVDE